MQEIAFQIFFRGGMPLETLRFQSDTFGARFGDIDIMKISPLHQKNPTAASATHTHWLIYLRRSG